MYNIVGCSIQFNVEFNGILNFDFGTFETNIIQLNENLSAIEIRCPERSPPLASLL